MDLTQQFCKASWSDEIYDYEGKSFQISLKFRDGIKLKKKEQRSLWFSGFDVDDEEEIVVCFC